VSRIPQLAVALTVLALVLLALAPLGWRLGLWHFRFSFFTLMTYSGWLAVAGVVVSVIAVVCALASLVDRRGAIQAVIALIVSGILVYVPWQWNQIRTTVPPIHDITTDTDNPPAFSAVLPARKAEEGNSVDYDPATAKLQKGYYTDLAPLTMKAPPAEAFKRALATAQQMSGWRIVATDPQAGRIEASQSSFWFGFTDDVVIRVAADGDGSRIDMRSEARQGRSDFGKNAERVRRYMAALKQAAG
jgi:uncharacterized protein (DUF1499 family)